MIILILLLLIGYILSVLACRKEMIIYDMNYSFNTLTNGAMIICFIPFMNTLFSIFYCLDRKIDEASDFKLTKKFFKK